MKICRCTPLALFSILLATVVGCQQQPRRQVIRFSPQGISDFGTISEKDGPEREVFIWANYRPILFLEIRNPTPAISHNQEFIYHFVLTFSL
jgi:hypothetical protein